LRACRFIDDDGSGDGECHEMLLGMNKVNKP
jgi:hypothetical protein